VSSTTNAGATGAAVGVDALTLDERISLGSGATFWTTVGIPRAGVPSLSLCDGPHGIRKQTGTGEAFGIASSTPATCFPTASALASSWDVDLLEEVGRAIGLEAIDQDVNVVLGPGVNMKRNPLCGRNFEYYSEDPLLAGKLAAAWIRGVQSTGTGTSLKHFALNNQELGRMTVDVRVDERALHEYYLPAFEIAVKEAAPTTVMCAYNRVEGVYCSDNAPLLRRILRERWGFQGAIMTDWGALHDRVAAYEAGLDLEMPGGSGTHDPEVRAAIDTGRLDPALVDESAARVLALAEATSGRDRARVPADMAERHHELARRAAAESAVLLKNERGRLPLAPGGRVAVIGELAETPRYQGTGSSLVTPTRLESLLDGVRRYAEVEFAPGYRLADRPDEPLLAQAVALAEHADRVIVCVGLTEIYESEGFDRRHMRIPSNQIALLEALAPLADRVVLVLCGGSAIEMPWESSASGILHMQLGGQAAGAAAADLLFGAANPSGRLAETYPVAYGDVVSASYYDASTAQAPYLESMFVGYRYFSSVGRPVRYPFGFGLSYTTFEYTDLRVERRGEDGVDVTFTVTNAGDRAGAEVAQVYVAPRTGGAHRPAVELKGFAKVRLEPGGRRTLRIVLDARSFAIFEPARGDWVVEAGDYEIRVAASVEDVRLRSTVRLEGVDPRRSTASAWYYDLDGVPDIDDFLTVHEPYPVLEAPRRGTYDLGSSIAEMKDSGLVGRMVYRQMERLVAKGLGRRDEDDVTYQMILHSTAGLPLRSMMRMSPSAMSPRLAQFLVDAANGRTWRGLWRLIRGGAS